MRLLKYLPKAVVKHETEKQGMTIHKVRIWSRKKKYSREATRKKDGEWMKNMRMKKKFEQ